MLNFLRQTRQLLSSTEKICLVVGNESCDLDSAVCAVSLAFFYSKHPPAVTKAKYFLPVLNIPQYDYATKTEVNYVFHKYSITKDMLTFCNELQPDLLHRCDCVLVDHHVNKGLATHCVAVFDHRPMDTEAALPPQCHLNIEPVGSCATLISAEILKIVKPEALKGDYKSILEMLRSTIILDTVNFSEVAARAKPKDAAQCAALEALLDAQSLQERKSLFDELTRARADISALTKYELLRKDLKILSSADGKICLALPGLPLPVHEFVNMPEVVEAVNEFVKRHNCDLMILLSLHVKESDGGVERELAIVNFSQPALSEHILEKLLQSTNPPLNLEEIVGKFPLEGKYFYQRNLKATRKDIIPIVKKVLEKWPKK